MLGHQLLKSWQGRHDVRVTVRGALAAYARHGLFHSGNTYPHVDACDTDRVLEVLGDFRPDAVINCVGIIKQRSAAKESIPSLEVNALLPHRLRLVCAAAGARLVHLSTDCVFNGRRGMYRQTDPADAEDLYGLSKYLGEVSEAPGITIRSSIIGLELSRKQSLIEWFLAQRGAIRGFTRAIYSGVTTAEMARVIEHILIHEPELHGLWQVASAPINKHDLLCLLASRLNRTDISITPDHTFQCDRSLDGSDFTRRTGYRVPDWSQMLDELAEQIQGRGALHEAA